MKKYTPFEIIAMREELATWPTWWLVKTAMWAKLPLPDFAIDSVKRWVVHHHFWGGRDQMKEAVKKITSQGWYKFCEENWNHCPEKGKAIARSVKWEIIEELLRQIQYKGIPMAAPATPASKKEEPRFVILSLVDLKESMRHTVKNSDLPKYLSAAVKWQKGGGNRIVLVQSIKSGQVLTAEQALAKIQSKK